MVIDPNEVISEHFALISLWKERNTDPNVAVLAMANMLGNISGTGRCYYDEILNLIQKGNPRTPNQSSKE